MELKPTDLRSTKLYQTLLGAQWNDVHPKVRGSHLSGAELRANCRLNITGCSHIIGKIIGRVASLPGPMSDAPVTLQIRQIPEGELWNRVFPDRSLKSIQYISDDGCLIDRFGMIAFCFRLTISNGCIIHCHERTELRWRGMKLTIPKIFSPVVTSHEEPDTDESASRIHVSLSVPIIGHLLTYNGGVRPVKEEA